MSSKKYLQSHWKQGVTLLTDQTRKWTPQQMDENNERENKMVFSNFSTTDRKLICSCENKEDAVFIALAPTMYKVIHDMWERVKQGDVIVLTPEISSKLEYITSVANTAGRVATGSREFNSAPYTMVSQRVPKLRYKPVHSIITWIFRNLNPGF